MKQILIFCIITLLSTAAFADSLYDNLGFPFNDKDQEDHDDYDSDYDDDNFFFFGGRKPQTLLGDRDITATGFGGPVFRISEINENPAYFIGGRGGAIFNEFFILGGGWNALVYPYRRSDITGNPYFGDYEHFHMFYTGPMVGMQFFQKSLINLSLTSVIGGGVFVYTNIYSDNDENEQLQKQQQQQQSTTDIQDPEFFFISEPTLLLHVNVTRWFRIGGGISYRYTNGVNNRELSDDQFRRWSTVIALDFGWF